MRQWIARMDFRTGNREVGVSPCHPPSVVTGEGSTQGSNSNFVESINLISNIGVTKKIIGDMTAFIRRIKKNCLQVEGFEINEEWWRSRYAYPCFINLKFPEFPLKKIFNKDHALLFCYFNNGSAFQEYVKSYTGNAVIIIGPAYGNGRHTDPQPFNVHFPSSNWKLQCNKEVKQTKDFIAFYIRC